MSSFDVSYIIDIDGEVIRSEIVLGIMTPLVGKLRRFCRDLGLMNPVASIVWRLAGLWDADTEHRAAPAKVGG